METLFEEHKGPVHQDDETFDEYRDRLKQENRELKEYRSMGRKRLKGDAIGSQRRRLLMKRMRRRGNPNG